MLLVMRKKINSNPSRLLVARMKYSSRAKGIIILTVDFYTGQTDSLVYQFW